MDPVSCLIVFRSLTQAQTAAAAFSRGGIGAALTLLLVSKPLLQKLERLQTKYGILEI